MIYEIFGFVRTLAIQPAVSFEQGRELRHGQAERIQTEDDYKRMLYMLDHEDNQMPLVAFTYARPGEKKPGISMSMEELVKSDPLKSFLQFSEWPMPGIGWDFPSAMENPVEYGKKMAEAAEPPEII